ncbi:MAG TPA: 2-C-methyl-D-erythritol 2,4-cyclodiphosphate synthase [bacterium]|nr:2-C-methyl-D-erythritol 2,4-cyclodiphosphate synthase [bacterium]
MSRLRIGTGFDVHALVEGRPLILGGVKIPHTHGLAGHSDADVLLHAVADALLGALALGDLGHWFPPGDPRYAGADSAGLLAQVVAHVTGQGWRTANLDCTVIAERPKLAPHVPAMRERLAQLLGVTLEQVSVKATTTETLGFTGRGEGIAAQAAVLLESAAPEP